MAVATHLADRSALAHLGHELVARRLGSMIEAGLVGTCGIIELEVRYSARSHPEYEEIRRDRGLGCEWFPMPDELWGRALEFNAHCPDAATPSREVPRPAHCSERSVTASS